VTTNLQAPFSMPPDATEVVLARHGSVSFSGDGLAGGGTDPPLTPRGVAQSGALADRLRGIRVDVLCASPLRRARETAAPLAEALRVNLVIVDELREVGLGEWEGQLSAKLREGGSVVRRLLAEQRWDVIPGAEPHGQFADRVRRGLGRVADLAGTGGTAVAVVHGGVIAEACHQATASERFAFLRSENGSVSRLIRAADGSWTLRSFNEVGHLENLKCD
jgi:probable phosphoglycerate mutase